MSGKINNSDQLFRLVLNDLYESRNNLTEGASKRFMHKAEVSINNEIQLVRTIILKMNLDEKTKLINKWLKYNKEYLSIPFAKIYINHLFLQFH